MTIQLRIKTEFSFGATYCPIDRAIERLKAIGCTAAGIVDIDSTWGHVQWFNACKNAEIQPLLGVDLTVSDDDDTGDNLHRMWFLAKSEAGLRELYGWTSQSYRQRVKTRTGTLPRLFKQDVVDMSDAIWKFAGDMDDEKLLKDARTILDINPSSKIGNLRKQKLASVTDLWLAATSDNAYPAPEDKPVFELIGKRGVKFTAQHILPELDYQDVAKAIADECTALSMPTAKMLRVEGNLESLCREGIRYRGMTWNEEYEKRLQYELELIRSKDFESYFIIVSDMMCYAKQHMLVGPSRGSSAGSLVCYLTRITEIDPIVHKLMFERFIDITRTDLPDVDADFNDAKREIVFEYMGRKYGKDNVAHIGTVSQYRPKSALIQVCKALNIPPLATAGVKIAMIERSSADSRATNCLEDTFKETEPGKQFIQAYPEAIHAQLLEGHASHTGIHAAGLLVSNEPIHNFATVNDESVAAIDKHDAEKLGLLKIDILGLRTLGILEDSGVKIDWYNLPLDDPKVYEIFNNDKLCGIFQFEGEAMRAISKQIKFASIVDVDTVTALARPGPFGGGVTAKYLERRNGKPYDSIHPLVEEQMTETYGLPIYQEQTLAIVREIGKFDWKETATIRKAMSKSMGKEFFDSYWMKFKAGAASQNIGEAEARTTWEMINSMGAWAMNASHTRSYAVISYWCAFLKRYFPLEFAAANLRSAKNEDSAIELLREISNEGIEYIPFDLHRSQVNWSVQDGKLYGGFMALKGIGEVKAAQYIEKRDAGTLTADEIDEIRSATNVFGDIFPFRRLYSHIYAKPKEFGIVTDRIAFIKDLTEGMPHACEHVFMGELIFKNARNINEEISIKKRGGVVMKKGPFEYMDMRLRDDTSSIACRISRWNFEKMGRKLLEEIPVGTHILVRAQFFNGFRYGFISKWKLMSEVKPNE